MSSRRGIVLFGHGSRDPQWRVPIEAVAARMRVTDPSVPVACAYLELTPPPLAEAAAALRAEGVDALEVVPMFLGIGRHAREDLPELARQLREEHPDCAVTLRPAVGEEPRVIELLADIALRPS